MFLSALLTIVLALPFTTAHTAAWAPGMYCRNGSDPSPTHDEPNTNLAVNPLYNLTQENWWFQHHRGCDAAPPKPGSFLTIPANGNFTVELAHNRAFTTLSYDGKLVSDWPDGKQHPEDWNGWGTDGTPAVCLKEDGALHTYNESSAGGTAFAISYRSDIKDVSMENLVVFTTLWHTPWKRLATYEAPDLPGCPEGGCTCAWLWVPNGCGQANMYMQGFKCNVTNPSSTAPRLAKAKPPVYCADDPSKCVKGAKQMIAWNQWTGNNIETKHGVTPNYNQKCGWAEGAQTDIFELVSSPSSSSSVSKLSPSTTSKAQVSRKPAATKAIDTSSIAPIPFPQSPIPVVATFAPPVAAPVELSSVAPIQFPQSPIPVVATTSGYVPAPTSLVSKKPCTRRQPRASARAAL